ncbi:short-chain dehydrogenase [Bisporella sp. PMI_857]|nr:short-chain dehydrogenase [Bisporella sp. PMI_857]
MSSPNVSFGPYTTGLEVASALKADIEGKTILITGVAQGSLGAHATLAIASSSPHMLILSARSAARADLVAAELRQNFPSIVTKILPINLASLAAVHVAAKEIESWKVGIDVLINSAAVMACPYSVTEDGIESQFGIGHLAHFLLTNLLLKAGVMNDGGRIVNVASSGHRFGGVRFDDISFDGGKTYNKFHAYGQAKTANMLFSLALASSKSLQEKGILSFSLQPGGVPETGLGRHLIKDRDIPTAIKEIQAAVNAIDDINGVPMEKRKVTMKTPVQAVSTYLFAGFSPSIADENGAYLDDCRVKEPVMPWGGDLEGARKLWEVSERMVGEEFAII